MLEKEEAREAIKSGAPMILSLLSGQRNYIGVLDGEKDGEFHFTGVFERGAERIEKWAQLHELSLKE